MLDNALSSSWHRMLSASCLASAQPHYSENTRVILANADQKTKKTTECASIPLSGSKFPVVTSVTAFNTQHLLWLSKTWSLKDIWSTYMGMVDSNRCSVQSNRINLAKLEDFTSKLNVLVKT